MQFINSSWIGFREGRIINKSDTQEWDWNGTLLVIATILTHALINDYCLPFSVPDAPEIEAKQLFSSINNFIGDLFND